MSSGQGAPGNMEEGLKKCLENRLKSLSSPAATPSKTRMLTGTKNDAHFINHSVSSEEHQKTLDQLNRIQCAYETLQREHQELMESMQVCVLLFYFCPYLWLSKSDTCVCVRSQWLHSPKNQGRIFQR
jgi:hypothetical protein